LAVLPWRLLRRGIPAGSSYLEQRSLLLLRIGCCLALLANALIIAGFLLASAPQTAWLNVLASTCFYSLSLVLSLSGRNELGRLLLTVALLLATMHLALQLPVDSGVPLFLIPIAIGGVVIWSGRRWVQIIHVSASTLAYLLVRSLMEQASPAFLSPSLVANTLVVFVCSFGIVISVEDTAGSLQRRLDREILREERLMLDALPGFRGRLAQAGQAGAAPSEAVAVVIALAEINAIARRLPVARAMELSQEVFAALDFLAAQHGLRKVPSTGYDYVAVRALQADEASRTAELEGMRAAADFSLAVQNYLRGVRLGALPPLRARIGIGVGEANLAQRRGMGLGRIWGSALDQASRLESSAEAGRIHAPERVRQVLAESHAFERRQMGIFQADGEAETWWLLEARSVSNDA